MRRIRKYMILLLTLALLLPLAPRVSAEDADGALLHDPRFEDRSWEEIVESFLADHGAKSDRVACGWCNTVTGEEHYHNGDQYMTSGSMYKVPMNMIFAEKVHNGEIGWNTFVGAYRYEYALHATIVDSNNEVARSMWNYLGGYQPYRHLLAPYMGEDPDTVDQKFYENNFSTPRQMIYSLKLLATESERFPRVIDEMLKAEPQKYFNLHEHDVDIAHKYGYYAEGAHLYLNDCAIVYTEEPICIVIFTDTVLEPYKLLADYCDLMIDYTVYSTAARKEAERIAAEEAAIAALNATTPAPEQTAPVKGSDVPAPAASARPSVTAAPAEKETPSVLSGVILPLVLSLFIALGALYFLVRALERARRGKLELPWALAAILLTAAALWLCVLPQRTETAAAPSAHAAAEREGDPRETVSAFFDALIAGDYPAAYSHLSGVSTLGLERTPGSEDAAALYDALRASWRYSLYGEPIPTAEGAVQQVVVYTLDFDALRAAVKEETEARVETLAAALAPEEIYAEDGAYLDSFPQRAYDEALRSVLDRAGDFADAVGLNLRLEYRAGEWLIIPDDALYGALSGGAIKGKGA